MDNYEIADQLQLLSKLMDIHGENAFKAKSYASAAFTIEKFPQSLTDLPEEKIFNIRGIGEGVGAKVMEIIQHGHFALLQEYIKKTPEGVLEMMNIKGLGPKKIHTLWKEHDINSIPKLKEACEKNTLAETKGFGEKTQQTILKAIEFQQENTGKYLYAQAETFANAFTEKMKEAFPHEETQITGGFRRQLEIIDMLEWITTIPKAKLEKFLLHQNCTIVSETDKVLVGTMQEVLKLQFHLSNKADFYTDLFNTSGSEEFLSAWDKVVDKNEKKFESENAIFAMAAAQYIPPFLREKKDIISKAQQNKVPDVLQVSDIKGIIHSHSNWSDGAYTLDEMAAACKDAGFEYLVISDHSKAAFYANGLSEQRIKEQHQYIDMLNKKLNPFKIFKSIECDILNDGAMDYSNTVLASFDLVIASVHSNLDMTEDKAMQRLMGAITNPYTTILGHMTGRRLLKRKSFPVNYEAVIDACASNNVVIEINASPQRLDMDWRWVDYALDKGVLLSINPDAHATEEFQNIKYGVLVAQKGGLTKTHNLSSFSLLELEDFLANRKRIKGIS